MLSMLLLCLVWFTYQSVESFRNNTIIPIILKRPHYANNITHESLIVNADIDISNNVSVICGMICDFFHADHLLNSNRCRVLMKVTTYSHRIQWVNNAYEQLMLTASLSSQESRMDATLLSLSLSLEAAQPASSTNAGIFEAQNPSEISICVFGSFSLKMFLMYSLSWRTSNIAWITDDMSSDLRIQIVDKVSPYADSQATILFLTEMQFVKFSRVTVCDVVHLRRGMGTHIFSHLVQNIKVNNHLSANNRNIVVIYEKKVSLYPESDVNAAASAYGFNSMSFHTFSQHVDWYASSLTPESNALIFSLDNYGFLHIIYDLKPFTHTTQLHFGSFKIQSEEKDANVIQKMDTPVTHMHIIITYSSRLFQDNAYGFQEALQLIPTSFTLNGENKQILITSEILGISPLADSKYFRGSDSSSEMVVQLMFGCHSPAIYLTHYICYQTEQPWSYILSTMIIEPHAYVSSQTMSHAVAVLAMSNAQLQMLYKTDFKVKNAYVVPFYTKTSRSTIPYDPAANDYKYDILLYGACTPSRIDLIERLMSYGVENSKRINTICAADWKTAIFDEELEKMIKESKIVVNNHSFQGSSLQVHRLVYLFSLHTCVVSERSTVDEGLDKEYEDVVIFTAPEDNQAIVNKANDLLNNESAWRECQNKSFEKFQAIHRDVSELSKVIYKSFEVIHNDALSTAL